MKNGKERVFAGVTDYVLSKDSRILVFKREAAENMQTVNRVDLDGNSMIVAHVIWQGNAASGFILDKPGRQLAFIAGNDKDTGDEKAIWYYNANMDKALPLANRKSPGMDGLEIEGLSSFNIDGKRLFFTLKESAGAAVAPKGVQVDIWSYRDAKLQSQQLAERKAGYARPYFGSGNYAAVMNITAGVVTRLQQDDEEWWPIRNSHNDDWGLVTKRIGDKWEADWSLPARPRYYLVSTRSGERKEVGIPFNGISPAGKYLVGDDGLGNFFTYELSTHIIRDITSSIPVPAGDAGFDKPFLSAHRGLEFLGEWLVNDAGMLLYDRYDIWQADPQGVKPPVNLTNGYGRRNNIVFRLIGDEHRTWHRGERLILDAFDNRNKQNGFYGMILGKAQDPVMLTMGPYVYYARSRFYLDGERPVRARDTAIYLVRRGSVTASPNYFRTTDFRQFFPLSHVNPEKRYNWLQGELVDFITLDGRKEQGILYKPENFDSSKRYPVIVHYYETMSERLHQYCRPGFSDGDINIPWFTSRGYLVFTPDIHYTIGAAGQSAYHTIVAAGAYLSRLPFVDARKMGLSGHSFGGYETNYIITHTSMFAAACADAGAVNLIGSWGSYERNVGFSLHHLHESSYYRMGALPWQQPELYVKNSPVFQVGEVTTPVLIINNKLDAVVHFAQGVQFFTGLCRLGKKAWLLQYEGEQHSLLDRNNKLDLTVRVSQFFDYYLKGAPAREWVVGEEPARRKE